MLNYKIWVDFDWFYKITWTYVKVTKLFLILLSGIWVVRFLIMLDIWQQIAKVLYASQSQLNTSDQEIQESMLRDVS